MPVPAKPSSAFRIPGHPFWAAGGKGLLTSHEGTGTPQVIQANGAKADVTYTDGATAGSTDPTWTTDALSSPSSNALDFADTARQVVATGCSAGTGMTAWTVWGTTRFDAANRNTVLVDLTPTNANGIKIRLGTARLIYLYLWLNVRNFGVTLVDGHAYSWMATVLFNGSGDQDVDLYLYDHDTATESAVAHFDLTHGSVQQVDEAPIINSRSVTGLTTSVGLDGKLWDIGWASNASGLVGSLSDFRAYYADPAAPWRASLQASPTSLPPDTADQDVALTGNTAGWSAGTPGTPTFNLGATNAIKVSQVVTTTTAASIRITTGAAETLTVTDGGTGAVVSIPVSGAGATGYSFTGPTSGTVGVASANFTVALTGGTVPTPNPVTVTPGDGGGGGTFTPPSVELSNGATSATFTYTAASAGAKTISTTDDGAYTDPTPITYTASVGGLLAGSIATGTPTRSAVNISSGGAGSGGQSPVVYSWEVAGEFAGVFEVISGQTGATLSDYSLGGYNRVKFFRRRVTDALAATAVTAVIPAATMPTDTLGVLLIGSSSTAGMSGANIDTALTSQSTGRYAGVVVSNQGVSGTETVHWLPPGHANASGTQRLATALSNASTDLSTATLKIACVLIGVNDARTSSRAVDTVMSNIRDICAYLLDTAGYHGISLPQFNYFIPGVGGSAAALALTQGYNAVLPQQPDRIDATRVFLGNQLWFAIEAANNSLILPDDGIHNTSAGYVILEKLIAEGIAKAALQLARPEPTAATNAGVGFFEA